MTASKSELMMGFMLFVDDTFTAVGKSLDEAKRLAVPYLSGARSLRIESAVAPAPTQTWNYDHDMRTWVERK